MADDLYEHPVSGRLYRQGDPAHRFAQLTNALARQNRELERHLRRLNEQDYLVQVEAWLGDCDRITRAMQATLDAIDDTRTQVVCDRDAPQYGLGTMDDEWGRKYG